MGSHDISARSDKSPYCCVAKIVLLIGELGC